ncbi:30401_t:CDS:2 [Gigaspora margarita]|uniref:30401_t:CDS:1 n=1 Tax=Gigaspora margarita TaxID=4874 RepID=A0ABN7VZY2_GIGMA|nr:30401_t:CDS:2 [Gigaspora margarita]
MSKTINQLKSKISSFTLKDQIFKSKLDSKEKLDKIIIEAIKNTEVGSTILAVAAANLARDLIYYTLQSILASIEVTKQYCKVSYYNYQAPIIEYSVKQAKESVQNWLIVALDYMQKKKSNIYL